MEEWRAMFAIHQGKVPLQGELTAMVAGPYRTPGVVTPVEESKLAKYTVLVTQQGTEVEEEVDRVVIGSSSGKGCIHFGPSEIDEVIEALQEIKASFATRTRYCQGVLYGPSIYPSPYQLQQRALNDKKKS